MIDKLGNPVEGALISVENNSLVQVTTDRKGQFVITADKDNLLRYVQEG